MPTDDETNKDEKNLIKALQKFKNDSEALSAAHPLTKMEIATAGPQALDHNFNLTGHRDSRVPNEIIKIMYGSSDPVGKIELSFDKFKEAYAKINEVNKTSHTLENEDEPETTIFAESFAKYGITENLDNIDTYIADVRDIINPLNHTIYTHRNPYKYITNHKLLRAHLMSGYSMVRVNTSDDNFNDLMYHMSYDDSKMPTSVIKGKKHILLFDVQDSHIEQFDANKAYWPIERIVDKITASHGAPVVIAVVNVIVEEFMNMLNS